MFVSTNIKSLAWQWIAGATKILLDRWDEVTVILIVNEKVDVQIFDEIKIETVPYQITSMFALQINIGNRSRSLYVNLYYKYYSRRSFIC